MDLIARDGDYYAFVEVRTRRGQEFGTPEESITTAKKGPPWRAWRSAIFKSTPWKTRTGALIWSPSR